MQDHGVALGDLVMFQGPTTGVVEQPLESMQVEHEAVSEASKGMDIAIKTGEPVRRNDKLYVTIPAS